MTLSSVRVNGGTIDASADERVFAFVTFKTSDIGDINVLENAEAAAAAASATPEPLVPQAAAPQPPPPLLPLVKSSTRIALRSIFVKELLSCSSAEMPSLHLKLLPCGI